MFFNKKDPPPASPSLASVKVLFRGENIETNDFEVFFVIVCPPAIPIPGVSKSYFPGGKIYKPVLLK